MERQNNSEYEKVLKPNMLAAMVSEITVLSVISIILGAVVGFTIGPVLGVAGFVLATALLSAGAYFNTKSREYRFGHDQVEWFEGFLTITQSNVSYNRITDISMSQPLMQRFFGTGTIRINTAGTDMHELRISYVDNPQQVYEEVKRITGN